MDCQDHTALHSAAKAGDREAAELLLREGIDIYCKDEQGLTPLHILIQKRIEMFDNLRAIGHKENVFYEVTPKDSKIDMHSVISQEISENEKFVDMLLNHNSFSFTCVPEVQLLNFHAACTLNDSSMAEQLSEHFDVNQSVDAGSPVYPGYTALHFAAHCNINTVKMLLSKRANLLLQDSNAVTPLQICTKSFSLEDVHSILTASAEWRYALFSDGKTKLVDYIFSLRNADSHKNFLQAMGEDVGVTLPEDSPLWPGYTFSHVAVYLLPESDLQMILDILSINPDLIIMQDKYGSTAVHLAFRINKLEVVESLLHFQETGENPQDDDNLSFLHIAAAVDNQKLAAEILDNEVNVDLAYKGEPLSMVNLGWTPLHVAVHTKHATIAKALLNRGANFLQTDAQGFTAIHQLLGINNMEDVAQFMFASDQLEERVVENVGLTHLHVAVWLNNTTAIERLLDLGSDIEATIGKFKDEHLKKFEGCRPIHLTTIDPKQPHAFTTLLIRGADVFSRRFDEPSPLIQMLTSKYTRRYKRYIIPIVELLWGNENLQQRMREELGLTMLHVLCYARDERKIQELLQRGADVNARIRNDSSYWPGFTPLHVFVWRHGGRRYENVCYLLFNAGANFALADAEGNTPLLLLLKTWCVVVFTVREFASYLLKQQRDFNVNPTNNFGMSHFHVACLLNEVEVVVEFLENNFTSVNEQISLASDDHKFAGKTPLLMALLLRTLNYDQAGRQIDTVNLLLNRGADVNAVDTFGRTALHYLAESSRTRIILLQKILSYEADINKRAKDGTTPMQILLSNCVPSNEVYIFLREGARINSYNPISDEGYMAIVLEKSEKMIKDRPNQEYHDILELMMNSSDNTEVGGTGRNAIHNAVAGKNTRRNTCSDGYVGFITKLMALGCNIFQQDAQGRTPLHLAVKFENAEATIALLRCGADVNIADIPGKSPFAYALELHKDEQHSWNLDGFKSQIEHDMKVGEILAVHLTQLQLIGLQVSELNAKLLTEVQRNSSGREWEKEIFFSQLERTKDIRMDVRGFTVFEFLHPTLVINSYPLLNQDDRDAIAWFFQTTDYEGYSRLKSFLRFQYNNAKQRQSLIQPAVNGLNQLLGFPVPDACVDTILKELTNLDLTNMIIAASVIERTEMIVE